MLKYNVMRLQNPKTTLRGTWRVLKCESRWYIKQLLGSKGLNFATISPTVTREWFLLRSEISWNEVLWKVFAFTKRRNDSVSGIYIHIPLWRTPFKFYPLQSLSLECQNILVQLRMHFFFFFGLYCPMCEGLKYYTLNLNGVFIAWIMYVPSQQYFQAR
jgi:hypothetical protein